MVRATVQSTDRPESLSPSRWQMLGHRVLAMALLWAALGAFMGLDKALVGAGWFEVMGHTVAGVIVLPVVGALLGLIGGRWKEALGGALCGFVIGVVAAVLKRHPDGILVLAHLCLLVGAIMGATLMGMLRQLAQMTHYIGILRAAKQ